MTKKRKCLVREIAAGESHKLWPITGSVCSRLFKNVCQLVNFRCPTTPSPPSPPPLPVTSIGQLNVINLQHTYDFVPLARANHFKYL